MITLIKSKFTKILLGFMFFGLVQDAAAHKRNFSSLSLDSIDFADHFIPIEVAINAEAWLDKTQKLLWIDIARHKEIDVARYQRALWSRKIDVSPRYMNHAEATNYCALVDGRLPSLSEYNTIVATLGTLQRQNGIPEFFQSFRARSKWTSSIDPVSMYPYLYGPQISPYPPQMSFAVQCVIDFRPSMENSEDNSGG